MSIRNCETVRNLHISKFFNLVDRNTIGFNGFKDFLENNLSLTSLNISCIKGFLLSNLLVNENVLFSLDNNNVLKCLDISNII